MWGVKIIIIYCWINLNLSFPVTCVPHRAHANQAEDEGDGEGGSHLHGDAPMPLLELLQRISPNIPILVREAQVQILQRVNELIEYIRLLPKIS